MRPFIALLLIAPLAASAQDSPEFKDGYAQGYRDGFEAGLRKGAAEEKRNTDAQSKGFPIAIQVAIYGTDSGNSRERCDATRHVKREANGRRSANVSVTNQMCGDPAPGKRKKIEITYTCGAVAKTASAYEHRSAYLYCD